MSAQMTGSGQEPLWVFDMDGTLYLGVDQVWDEITHHMGIYLRSLGYPVDMSPDEQRRLRKKWDTNQTTVCYVKEFRVDFDVLVERTHLPIIDSLKVELRKGIEVIERLPGKKVVLTNSPAQFAHALLKKLNIHHLFDEIYGLHADVLEPKPHRNSYARIASHPHTIMIEDWHHNLSVPHDSGWSTVWFPEEDQSHIDNMPSYVHKHITSLEELWHFATKTSHP